MLDATSAVRGVDGEDLDIRSEGALPTSMRSPERALLLTSTSSRNGEESAMVTEP